MTFSKFEDVVSIVRSNLKMLLLLSDPWEKSVLMAKLDIKHAFRLCPVRPTDLHLLGTHWEGCYVIELQLPFSLHSSVLLIANQTSQQVNRYLPG